MEKNREGDRLIEEKEKEQKKGITKTNPNTISNNSDDAIMACNEDNPNAFGHFKFSFYFLMKMFVTIDYDNYCKLYRK